MSVPSIPPYYIHQQIARQQSYIMPPRDSTGIHQSRSYVTQSPTATLSHNSLSPQQYAQPRCSHQQAIPSYPPTSVSTPTPVFNQPASVMTNYSPRNYPIPNQGFGPTHAYHPPTSVSTHDAVLTQPAPVMTNYSPRNYPIPNQGFGPTHAYHPPASVSTHNAVLTQPTPVMTNYSPRNYPIPNQGFGPTYTHQPPTSVSTHNTVLTQPAPVMTNYSPRIYSTPTKATEPAKASALPTQLKMRDSRQTHSTTTDAPAHTPADASLVQTSVKFDTSPRPLGKAHASPVVTFEHTKGENDVPASPTADLPSPRPSETENPPTSRPVELYASKTYHSENIARPGANYKQQIVEYKLSSEDGGVQNPERKGRRPTLSGIKSLFSGHGKKKNKDRDDPENRERRNSSISREWGSFWSRKMRSGQDLRTYDDDRLSDASSASDEWFQESLHPEEQKRKSSFKKKTTSSLNDYETSGLPHEAERLIDLICDSIIGDDIVMEGPFGPRRVTYADYTASGRSLEFIEDYIREQVLPMYANTHTETSGTGRQTTRFREDARAIIKKACGADERDALIFCGTGVTGAIHKLIGCLNIAIPRDLDTAYGLSGVIPPERRPVVFIGPYEHHSNEIPWRETICDVVTIPEDIDGQIDIRALEAALCEYATRPLKIGSFSAASNVTGILSDTDAIATVLHKHGALSFWDYAAAGPYIPIQTNPLPEMHTVGGVPANPLAYKDAVFISPHKFIGGPGTPGILIAKCSVLRNKVPSTPGGGTVAYVSPTEHHYVPQPEHREEGGTPGIVEAIRAGLVMQLKESVGTENIRTREEMFIRRAIAYWTRGTHSQPQGKSKDKDEKKSADARNTGTSKATPESPESKKRSGSSRIYVLGSLTAPRLSIVSFVIRHGNRFLHHNYCVALLNDLFGIQSRGGCSCAGPYGHRLLHIDSATSKEFESVILTGEEGIKPGWARINFNYFISEQVFRFLVRAICFLSRHGWKFLPLYEFCPDTGSWRHRKQTNQTVQSLHDIHYVDGRFQFPSRKSTLPSHVLNTYIPAAKAILKEFIATVHDYHIPPDPSTDGEFQRLRWFPTPNEALAELRSKFPKQ